MSESGYLFRGQRNSPESRACRPPEARSQTRPGMVIDRDVPVLTSDQLNWRFSKMTRRGGIGRWHLHGGRHTAVSIMSSSGVPIQQISDTPYAASMGRCQQER